jgi:hypothetical protein
MDRIILRRALVWTALGIYVVALGVALFGIWQASGRQWYIDGAGIDVTLTAGFTDLARWLITAALGALLLVGFAGLVFDVIVSRRAERLLREALHVPPDAVATGLAQPAIPAVATEEVQRAPSAEVRPVRYESAVVGADANRRTELSVSPSETATAAPVPVNGPGGSALPPAVLNRQRDDDVRATLTRMERQLDELRRRVESGESPASAPATPAAPPAPAVESRPLATSLR